MKKISFIQKNDLIVKYTSGQHFNKDLELFQKHFPSNKLNTSLARANMHTYARLDGAMLNLLLDKISIDEILQNRNQERPESPKLEIIEDPVNVEQPITPVDIEVPVSSDKKKAKAKNSQR